VARGSSKSSGSTRNQRNSKAGGTSKPDTVVAEQDETIAQATDSASTDAEASVTAEGTAPATENATISGKTDAATPAPVEPTPDLSDPVMEETPPPADPLPELSETVKTGDDTLTGAAGDDTLAGTTTVGDAVSTDGDETVTLRDIEDAELATDAPKPTSRPATVAPPPPAPQRSGGFVPMVLGGIIAAGIGYGAAYMGWLPVPADAPDEDTTIATTVQGQGETLAELQAQFTELSEAVPPPAETPAVDLAPLQDEIAALSDRVDGIAGNLEDLTARVETLEDRPILSGDAEGDTAAALEAAERLEAELEAEREAAATRAAELEAQAEAATSAAAEAEAAAEAAIADAQSEAEAATARAAADAALGQVRVALETGEPFAEPLAALSEVTEVPEGLAAVADTGVATLDALQQAFPPLARAALPVALQETSGEAIGDRFGAFVMGQLGGRSVEPRDGDDPDAILSRIEAAVRAGDLETALAEQAALPEGAQAELAAWVAQVEARAGAEAGYADLAAALAGNDN